MKKTRELLAVGAVLTGLLGTATPVHADGKGLYLGMSAGVVDADGASTAGGINSDRLVRDNASYKVFGGYRGTRNFALEGGYRTFAGSGGNSFKSAGAAWDVSALGLLLIGPVDVFAKGGVILLDTNGRGALRNRNEESLTWGIGGALNIGNLWLRVESEWFDPVLPDEVQLVTASVAWSF